jgi:TrkA domain protein
VSVIAVQRGTETVENPDADFELRDGDVLVTLGTREEQNAVEELLASED